MRARGFWLTGVGLIVTIVMWLAPQGWADEMARSGATTAPASMALVGTIVAVVLERRTLVVDVPLGQDTLRVAAWVTDRTTVTQAGTPTTLDKLAPGARVRIAVRRLPGGNEAVAVEVLSGTTR
jgi:hypothetical protein